VTIVDAHVHVIPAELLRSAAPDEPWRPDVRREDGAQVVELGGRAIRSAVREFVDVRRILDESGADRVILAPWVPLLFGDLDGDEALPRLRAQNEALASIVRDHGERVAALGAVPLQDPEVAAAELRELMGQGDLAGVEVAARTAGDYLGDDRFEPFWAAAEATGAFVFVHPSTRGFAGPGDYYLWNTVGNPLETTVTAAHMVMAGVLERHPGLRVMLAHGGGAVLALRGRLRHAHERLGPARARLREPVEDSLRRFFYDTVTHDAALLRTLVDFAGAEHVLLGSDFPFDMADARPADTVRAAGLGAEAEAAVLGANAQRLLGKERVR
jgi:aminocarboxymuconate-semialdehyde decarboxylase